MLYLLYSAYRPPEIVRAIDRSFSLYYSSVEGMLMFSGQAHRRQTEAARLRGVNVHGSVMIKVDLTKVIFIHFDRVIDPFYIVD